jgi:hypothetical protein
MPTVPVDGRAQYSFADVAVANASLTRALLRKADNLMELQQALAEVAKETGNVGR